MPGSTPLWHRRLPCAGLMGSATAGILAAAFSGIPSTPFLAGFAAFSGVWLIRRRALWLYAAVACGFAVLQVWQTRESQATALAESIGEHSLPASAVGKIISDPVATSRNKIRFRVELESLEMEGRTSAVDCGIQAVVPADCKVFRGDTVEILGSLRRIPAPRNPAQFDARRVMALQGITCELAVTLASDLTVVREGTDLSLPRIASRCREWMEKTLRLGIADQVLECDLIAGLVLGVTADIPEDLQNRFRRTGTYHLFSVSGLHVGMIAVILWQILSLLQVGRRPAVAIIIPALFFYALLTGWKPPSIRAAIMTAIFMAGMAASRQQVPFNSLCAAGLAILAQSTNELFNPGFQFSFLVVAAILVFERPIRNAIRTRLRPDPFIPAQLWNRRERAGNLSGKWGAEILGVSVAAWLGSLPLTILFFGIVSISGLIANPIVVPLSFVIMATSMGSLGAGTVAPWISEVLNNANLAFVKILVAGIQAISTMPFAYIPVAPFQPGTPEVVVFDFSSGGGAAIRSEKSVWLLDCGSSWDFQNCIAPWLRQAGRITPDGLVLTHGDADHIAGATELIPESPPRQFVDSPLSGRSTTRKKIHAALEAAGLPKSIHRAGDALGIGGQARLHFLHPPAVPDGRNSDDRILVARLDISGTRILFLSDAGPATTDWLLKNRPKELAAEVLAVGRHESGILPDGGFLDAVDPGLVVASAAAFPDSETLPPEWAEMVRSRGIRLFRQDETGGVTVHPGTNGFTARGFANGEIFTGQQRPR